MSTIKADNYEATTAGNNLIFKANGTEKMRVSPNVGGITNITGVGVGLGGNAINLNANGTTVHIHEPTAGGASVLHCTNAAQGIGANKGFICGLWSTNDAYCYTYDPVSLHFGTNSQLRMTVTSAGNVGIGTTTPAQKLDVTGTIKASSGLVLGDATFTAPSGTAPLYGARAWVTYSTSAGVATILSSGNVASITRSRGTTDGTTNYSFRIAFTTAMPTANYAVAAMCTQYASNNSTGSLPQFSAASTTAPSAPHYKTTSGFDIQIANSQSGAGGYDNRCVSLVVFC
jgi:hypothetical protein